LRALLRSAEELRKAQERALGGKGISDLQARLAEQRQAVRALARLGRDVLADEGRPASDAIVERIAKTLDAAALDEGARFQLRAGRLTEELEPPGFEALAGMKAVRPRRSDAAKPKASGAAEARRRVEEAKRQLRARTREAVEAERNAERAEAAASEARGEAGAARKRADEAERRLAEAETSLRKARRS
jgi:colicin import membrane protein